MPQLPPDPTQPMPERGGPPPGAGGPGSPDAVMAADRQVGAQKRAMLASTAPQPSKPFSTKAIQTLIKQFNDTVEAFSGGVLPDVTWEPMEKGAKWNNPLPEEIYAPLAAMRQAVDVVGGGEFKGAYQFQPTEITDDMGVRKATAEMMKMSKDKKLIAAMRAPLNAAAGEAGQEAPSGPSGRAPMQSNMSPDDKALMANMK